MSFTYSSTLDVKVDEMVFDHHLVRLELSGMWDYIQTHNPSGDLPYHNNKHLFHVARIASLLLSHSFYNDTYVQRLVITAALFHDVDHSGGTCTDEVNINRAVAAMRKYFADHPTGWANREGVLITIEQLIRNTQYPFQADPYNAASACLRDADLLYSLSEERLPEIMDGLRAEMSVSQGYDITLADMVEKQKGFIGSVVMYTQLGQQLWDNNKDHVLSLQQQYAQLTDNEE